MNSNAVILRVCKKLFSRCGNFSIEDTPRSGRPIVIENDQLKQIVDQNPHFTTKEIEDIVNVSKGTFSANFKCRKKNEQWAHKTLILCPIWFFIISWGNAFLFSMLSPNNNLRTCEILTRWDSAMAFELI